MAYTNSKLVNYTKLSPNHSGQRNHAIDTITPHCVVGQCSVETIGNIFAPKYAQTSSNYGIGTDGRVGMFVEEKNRSWCSSSSANDNRAITIECASDYKEPYAFNNKVYNKLIDLCVDICKRNGKTKIIWFGDKNKTLNYKPAANEMLITVHRWFANKSCPGDWLYSRLGDLALKVNAKLGSANKQKTKKKESKVSYIVQVGVYSKNENAKAMVKKLKAAGFDATIKTENKTVNTVKKSNADIAKEILKGTCSDSRWSVWGNGNTRIKRLKTAGYDPIAVQNEVNKLVNNPL